MFKKFERKMAKSEFSNIMSTLKRHFDEDKAIHVFIKLMENATYIFQTGNFSNKFSLVFDTNVNVILHRSDVAGDLFEDIEQIIEHNEGIEKQYFLFSNYHKNPQMWRLEDNRCIWGMVHESYKPLQRHYLNIIEQARELQKKQQKEQLWEKYVDQYVELEESDMGTRNYI